MLDLKCYEQEINQICEAEGIEIMGIFGSVSRGEEKEESDIDIIIKYKNKDKTLFDLIRLENKLTNLFGRKVDLLTEESISPYIVDEIEKDVKLLYC
ncbi:nucleotidyltransferase family protein [Natroniella sulfidigena]|uniref:nucleotidyltransferase family protein n=1 Tax=Natroniella sulfidigena TaxID=723921 RepID=UPI00200B9B9F|nr:nucleotidyltransferase family protein [Natroniella sulfidigena]MCK8817590.1 nucleotidyltransferase family protein [Natroniella sulfidigena]